MSCYFLCLYSGTYLRGTTHREYSLCRLYVIPVRPHTPIFFWASLCKWASEQHTRIVPMKAR